MYLLLEAYMYGRSKSHYVTVNAIDAFHKCKSFILLDILSQSNER